MHTLRGEMKEGDKLNSEAIETEMMEMICSEFSKLPFNILLIFHRQQRDRERAGGELWQSSDSLDMQKLLICMSHASSTFLSPPSTRELISSVT